MKFIFIFLLFHTFSLVGQVGIHGDVFLGSSGIVGFHVSSISFFEGVLNTDEVRPGNIYLFSDTQINHPTHASHSEAPIISYASEFVYPIGDQGVYHPLAISEGDHLPLGVWYKKAPHSALADVDGLSAISSNFHWLVDGEKIAHLHLSWNIFSELASFVKEIEALTLVGYTGTNWEEIPARLAPYALDELTPTSLVEGSIKSIDKIDFSRYESITLGAKIINTELGVSEAITPNGDGINDTWYIENITRYPEAQIWVYNRWGDQVFYSNRNYQNDWDATYNRFTKILPAGPYYYQIDHNNDKKIDQEGWLYVNY